MHLRYGRGNEVMKSARAWSLLILQNGKFQSLSCGPCTLWFFFILLSTILKNRCVPSVRDQAIVQQIICSQKYRRDFYLHPGHYSLGSAYIASISPPFFIVLINFQISLGFLPSKISATCQLIASKNVKWGLSEFKLSSVFSG